MQIDYKPIASGVGANVVSQAAYEAALAPAGALENGYVAGEAQSQQVNKTVRQSSMIASAVATFISNALGIDVLDDGDLAALTTNLTDAIAAAAWSTGDIKSTMKTVADAGWILFDDGSIGSATSGATYANALAQDLFTLIWDNTTNAICPVSTGKGATAAADWAANKRITLPKVLGRSLAAAGAGAGLTARTMGSSTGAETVALTVATLPTHKHTLNDPGHIHAVTDPGHGHNVTDPGHHHTAGKIGQPDFPVNTAAGINIGTSDTSTSVTGLTVNQSGSGVSVNSHVSGITMDDKGNGDAHANMQPTSFFNVMIKL